MKNKIYRYTPTDGNGTYRVCYGNDIKKLNQYIKPILKKYKSPIYIVDKNLEKNFIKKIEKITNISTKNICIINPDKKTLNRLEKIWFQMVTTVPDLAIVVGGGTVCDLSGFACATYQRGIPRILFPTTVLSMVDASIGGKSGIDYAEVKNSIGSIHYPIATASYVPFLKKLDHKEYNSGFAEIIKAAVLYDRKFFDRLYQYIPSKNDFESEELLDIFFTSSQIKARVCEEKGKKKISLLYGHSVGHAIERYEEIHMRHGDCVAIGMTIEGGIACLLGIWDKTEWHRQQEIIRRFNLPTKMPIYINLKELVKKMVLYKKLVDNDNYLFSLPKSIGKINNQETTYLTPIKRTEIINVLNKTLEWINTNK